MSSKNLEIERLRAVAVLLVVYAHAPFNRLFTPYLYSTFTGVDLFFVISGFVVSRSFMRSIPDFGGLDLTTRISQSRNQVVTFYLRRVFRILPSASFYMMIAILVSGLLHRDGSNSSFAYPANIFREIVSIYGGIYNYALAAGAVTDNLAPYWSLAVEEHFYLFTPILLVLCARRQQRIAALLAGIAIVLAVFRPLTSGNIINVSHTRFDALFYGVLISVIFERPPKAHISNLEHMQSVSAVLRTRLQATLASNRLQTTLKTTIAFSACALLALLPGVTNTALLDGTASSNFDTSSAALLSYELVSVALVLLASLNRGWIFEIPLLRSLLEYIGSRSYAVYLAHWVVVQIYNDLFFRYYENIPEFLKLTRMGYGIQFTAYVAISFLVAEASYRLIERPFIGVGNLFLTSTPPQSKRVGISETG
ncbi:peptidoglycan/LPS O-acetylase OafA/YrhL [Paraburkholderia sp. BL23I1N1]|uniref:acyltransferase family protein n=1 Tax=Paraburkholderia sp. BL23I1N1 TaxID=1938802 RepID=UPI000FF6D95F|nr:acyltransferase [Paraburkholderia sp. BL23I1N1]RKE26301.1 peptidoglycan/LPS O-acetylase OafA/YrhL [Paraburkholderia sp. BL23I1N1]